MKRFEQEIKEYFRANQADKLEEIRSKGTLPEGMDQAMETFLKGFDIGSGN